MLAIYCRVSTDGQDIDMQRHAITQWAQGIGRDISAARWYVDKGISGAKSCRPALNELRCAIQKGQMNEVIIYALDRLSRSSVDGLQMMLQWMQAGVTVYSITQPLLGGDGPMRLTMLAFHLEIAQMERIAIGGRVKAGLAAAKSRGIKLGRPALQESTISQIEHLRQAGYSQRKIAQQLGLAQSTISKALAG